MGKKNGSAEVETTLNQEAEERRKQTSVTSEQMHLEGIATPLGRACDALIEVKQKEADLKLKKRAAMAAVKEELTKEGRESVKISVAGKVWEIKVQEVEDEVIVKQISREKVAEASQPVLPGTGSAE